MSTFWTPEDFEWRRSRVVRDLYGAGAPGDLPGVDDDDEVQAGTDDADEFEEDEDDEDEERDDADDEGAEEAS